MSNISNGLVDIILEHPIISVVVLIFILIIFFVIIFGFQNLAGFALKQIT